MKARLTELFAEHHCPSFVDSEMSTYLHTESSGHLVELDKIRILAQEPKWIEWHERGHTDHSQPPHAQQGWDWYKLPHVWDNLSRSHMTQVSDLKPLSEQASF